jgi:hypothetical protein
MTLDGINIVLIWAVAAVSIIVLWHLVGHHDR